MKFLRYSAALLCLLSSPATPCPPHPIATKKPRPLVLWHGLGDSHSSQGMLDFQSAIKDIHPGIFIHSVYIEEDLAADRKAGFFGKLEDQIAVVAEQIAGIEELHDGFDAIGFSQGGQFLRAYVEWYSHTVPVHNLITFGSPHMGVSDIARCSAVDIPCQLARRLAKSAVYSKWAQDNVVQAQYFRDPENLATYLTSNTYLTNLNNEIPTTRNTTYARNLASLDKLVLILFDQDRTLVPKETAWFGSEAVPEDDTPPDSNQIPLVAPPVGASTQNKTIIPMRCQPLYIEDWIGLRALDERGGVVLETCEGEHMRIGTCWEAIVRNFTGSLV